MLLYEAAGGDYPNLDAAVYTASEREQRLHPSRLPILQAEDMLLVCLGGKAEIGCDAWLFSGRYGEFIVRLVLRAGHGFFKYPQFLSVVRELDRRAYTESSAGDG